MAYAALEQCGLDKVIFVPAYISPHKRKEQLKTAKHRYRMVRLAVRGYKNLQISDTEVQAEQTSYTIRTVRRFCQNYPKSTKFYFLIGADSLKSLHTWKNIDELKKMVSFVCVNRGGYRLPKSKIKARTITMPGLDISSTNIRQRIKRRQEVHFLIPKPVDQYIRKHRLYR